MNKSIDLIFSSESIEILKKLVGKKLISVRHSDKDFTSQAIRIVQFDLEEESCCLNSDTFVVDYYGGPEDVVRLFMTEGQYGLSSPSLYSFPVEKWIQKVSVVNYHILDRYVPGGVDYLCNTTAAIILYLDDGSEMSFQRLDDFNEIIKVDEGTDLINKVRSPELYYSDDSKDWTVLDRKVDVIELK